MDSLWTHFLLMWMQKNGFRMSLKWAQNESTKLLLWVHKVFNNRKWIYNESIMHPFTESKGVVDSSWAHFRLILNLFCAFTLLGNESIMSSLRVHLLKIKALSSFETHSETILNRRWVHNESIMAPFTESKCYVDSF